MLKRCPDCKENLDIENFYVSKHRRPDGYSYRCKKCTSDYSKLHKIERNLKRKEWRHKNKPLIRPKGIVRYKSRGKEYCENWVKIRKIIYERDNWTCQECDIKCHGNGTKDRIQCHHIDYDVLNNTENNLITLCASCHAKTNYDRLNWINYYKQKVLRKD